MSAEAKKFESTSVAVAVRCRPFNRREKKLNAKCCISMNEQGQTLIKNPGNGAERTFTFDHSYWSHEPGTADDVDNTKIYATLGQGVLEQALGGFNSCIFAYGQTGAGKTHSMMGIDEDPGIVPRMCTDLFSHIAARESETLKFRIEVSYYEVYNEQVFDLLRPSKKILKVRNHKSIGPYVEGLAQLAVNSYSTINELMEQGFKNRTTAATAMNDTSSRSHAVFTMQVKQETLAADKKAGGKVKVVGAKLSKISLVDLAGSERQSKTGASGARLKEGSTINKSLTTLGMVISALADASKKSGAGSGKKADSHVPYRDSTLTFLLKECLGGNAKTVMVAAISPADDNFDESMSTLRYADRAKQIVNKAFVNEDATARIIRELRAELEALKKQQVENTRRATGGGADSADNGASATEVAAIKAAMDENMRLLDGINVSWEERLRQTEAELRERAEQAESRADLAEAKAEATEKENFLLLEETIKIEVEKEELEAEKEQMAEQLEKYKLLESGGNEALTRRSKHKGSRKIIAADGSVVGVEDAGGGGGRSGSGSRSASAEPGQTAAPAFDTTKKENKNRLDALESRGHALRSSIISAGHESPPELTLQPAAALLERADGIVPQNAASSPFAAPDMSIRNWLVKRKHGFLKKSHKRWFVWDPDATNSSTIGYYEQKGSSGKGKKLLGGISIGKGTSIRVIGKEIDVVNVDRIWELTADTPEVAATWAVGLESYVGMVQGLDEDLRKTVEALLHPPSADRADDGSSSSAVGVTDEDRLQVIMDVRAGRITIDQAEAELDRLEQEATASWLNVDGNSIAAQMAGGADASADGGRGAGDDAAVDGGGAGADADAGGDSRNEAINSAAHRRGSRSMSFAAAMRRPLSTASLSDVHDMARAPLMEASEAIPGSNGDGDGDGDGTGGGSAIGLQESELVGDAAGAYAMLEPETAPGTEGEPVIMRDVDDKAAPAPKSTTPVPAAAAAARPPSSDAYAAALTQLAVPPHDTESDSDSDDDLPSDPDLPPDPED